MSVAANDRRHAALIEVRELCAELNSRARELGPKLLPNGIIAGAHLKTFNVEDRPRRKGSGRSLVLNLFGAHAGHWIDHGGASRGEDKGDILDLIAIVKCGGDRKRAIEWAKIEIGFTGGSQRDLEQRQMRRAAEAVEMNAKVEADTQARRDKAKSLYLRAIPLTDGRAFPVVDYLRHRMIDLRALGRAPGALRYLPECWNAEAGRRLPAMIAAVQSLDGDIMGVHRTYLDCIDGRWVKHPRLANAKLTFGGSLGGHVPLWKGDCTGAARPPLARIGPDTPVYVSEGIEDGLSFAMGRRDARVIAAVSLSKLGALCLPDAMGPLIVIAQNDPPESKAVKSLEREVGKLQLRGRRVQTIWPPKPHKDFNDWLRAAPHEALGLEAACA
jgi:hypothetical protein